MSKVKSETPLMKQYNLIKSKYPDTLLLFRVGDFYETFVKMQLWLLTYSELF